MVFFLINNSVTAFNNTKSFSTESISNKLYPNYVTGFIDGEGCFYIGTSRDSKYRFKCRIKLSFIINSHEKDK